MLAARVVVVMLLLAGAAVADDKVDAAKTQTCEKTKKFLADQKAKGKCAPEAEEAAKLTCSAATYKPMNELLQKCTTFKAVPAAAATPKCRALDAESKVIDEAEDKLATKCSTALLEKLKRKWCVVENKGKSFPYTLDFDHMNGAKKMEPTKRTWTCRSVVK
ncbi:MAG: hypothetical protein M4D80_32985 [Myxococcota bacterium]|nr:hypothetical protein [Deltaproteobacteria bacterium]MDQ3340001.1 hypothetical protein [Myxococcota bacterium]